MLLERDITQTPFFLNIDGPSASGKDRLINALVHKVKESDPRIRVFKFAENETVGLDRQLALQARSERGELGMVEEIIRQRLDVFERIVSSFLSDGTFVIANRWLTSTLAYQTLDGELSMQDVWDLHIEANILIPPLVVITRCSVETAVERESIRSTNGHLEVGLSGKMTGSLERREKLHMQYELTAEFLRSKGVRCWR